MDPHSAPWPAIWFLVRLRVLMLYLNNMDCSPSPALPLVCSSLDGRPESLQTCWSSNAGSLQPYGRGIRKQIFTCSHADGRTRCHMSVRLTACTMGRVADDCDNSPALLWQNQSLAPACMWYAPPSGGVSPADERERGEAMDRLVDTGPERLTALEFSCSESPPTRRLHWFVWLEKIKVGLKITIHLIRPIE